MRILLCQAGHPGLSKISYPMADGGILSLYHLSKELSKNHKTYLFFLDGNSSSLREVLNTSAFEKRFFLDSKESSLVRAGNILLLASKLSRTGYPRLKRIVEEEIRKIIEENDIDVIHCRGLYMGLLLANFSYPKFLDLVDCSSLYSRRSLHLTRSSRDFLRYVLMRKAEKYLMEKFEIITVVSPADKRFLKKSNEKADIRVNRNGVDMSLFSPSEIEEDHPNILFHGNMSFPPNIDAVLYISREILPLIRRKVPDVKFYVVGTDPHYEIKKLAKDDRVVVTGFVKDIAEYISRSSVVLIPMRMGSGIKNKILEAMALGKPVVTNPMGAECFDSDTKQCLAIGKGSREIAQRTIELLGDRTLRVDLGRRASEIVRKRYTWEACSARFEKIYKDVCLHR